MMDPIAKEKLELLDGSRTRAALGKAAVRIEDFAELFALPVELTSARTSEEQPTQIEFNKLVDDVEMLFQRMKALSEALQARLLP